VLRNVKRELTQNYYDPTFHGMDIEARFKLADEKVKNAESLGQLGLPQSMRIRDTFTRVASRRFG
jgi:hypothetical protein